MSYFENWQPDEKAWRPLQTWDLHCPVASQTMPLRLHGNESSPITLGRFESSSSYARNESDVSSDVPRNSDVLLHAGGPVWALGWCPESTASAAAPTSSTGKRYLAVGCHSHEKPLHQLGKPVSGPNSIQIWEVETSMVGDGNDRCALPRLALILAHNGGLTWDICWCPGIVESAQNTGLPRLGLLSAVLGDGSVNIWAVPMPDAIQSQNRRNWGTVAVEPAPVARCSPQDLGNSLPCRVDWLPDEPHDLLLLACWDGTVAIARLNAGKKGPGLVGREADKNGRLYGMELLCHFPADFQPLRAAKWLPAGTANNSLDKANRYIFATAGHEGTIKIWDARDQFAPLISQSANTPFMYDLAWSKDPLGVVVVTEDASIRALLVDGNCIAAQASPVWRPATSMHWRGYNAGALWALATDSSGTRAIYGGEDGVLGLMPIDLYFDARRRRNHTPLSAIRVEAEGVLRIITSEELATEDKNAGLPDAMYGIVERIVGLTRAGFSMPDASQTIQCLAWAEPTVEGGNPWVAVGTAAGLVRCHAVVIAE